MKRSSARKLIRTLLFAVALCGVVALGPPAIAGDDASECGVCHEQITRAFEATIHGRIRAFEAYDGQVGCVSCHGDGTAHMEGDIERIVRFTSEMVPEEVAGVCMNCHRSGELEDWHNGSHFMSGVGCTDCHSVHAKPDRASGDPDSCMKCHADVQAQMQYPSHHPVREGHMKCGSCHQPHGTSIGMLNNDERLSELCFTCHTYLQGPFMFEHEPVLEGCETCHDPHGTVANNLLVQTEPFLCLQCHEMHFHAGLEGEPEDEVYIPRYNPANNPVDGVTYPNGMVPTPWRESGYKRAFTTKCTQCHTEIHGTDSPSQSVPGMGGGLIR